MELQLTENMSSLKSDGTYIGGVKRQQMKIVTIHLTLLSRIYASGLFLQLYYMNCESCEWEMLPDMQFRVACGLLLWNPFSVYRFSGTITVLWVRENELTNTAIYAPTVI